jgi:hypothetical protein
VYVVNKSNIQSKTASGVTLNRDGIYLQNCNHLNNNDHTALNGGPDNEHEMFWRDAVEP